MLTWIISSATTARVMPPADLALRRFLRHCARELRAVDTTARLGGDEFAIILPQAALEARRSWQNDCGE